MINKFPSQAMSKRGRYSTGEKGMIVYTIILVILLIFVPILQLSSITGAEMQRFAFFNKFLRITDIIIGASLMIMMLWN